MQSSSRLSATLKESPDQCNKICCPVICGISLRSEVNQCPKQGAGGLNNTSIGTSRKQSPLLEV